MSLPLSALSFLWLNSISLCIYLHFVYPFISFWTFGLFLLMIIVNDTVMNVRTSLCVNMCFQFSGVYPRGIAGSNVSIL